MDLPARRRFFHPEPKDQQTPPLLSDSRHERDRPGICGPARRNRQRRRRQSNHSQRSPKYPRALGGVENGYGKFRGLLRRGKFPAAERKTGGGEFAEMKPCGKSQASSLKPQGMGKLQASNFPLQGSTNSQTPKATRTAVSPVCSLLKIDSWSFPE